MICNSLISNFYNFFLNSLFWGKKSNNEKKNLKYLINNLNDSFLKIMILRSIEKELLTL